jgi:hypothetical protein
MELKEIRNAYREILAAFNEAFPPGLRLRTAGDDITENFDKGDESLIETVRAKAKERGPKLREAADESGNARVWRSGEPLEGLPQNMKERIERALKLGI